ACWQRGITMFRKFLPMTILTLSLSAAPSFAQSEFVQPMAPHGSTAARTLEQNRRIVLAPATSETLSAASAERPALPRDRTRAARDGGTAGSAWQGAKGAAARDGG
ncbi:MAG TPA: hypothetical protein VEX11_13675, partial [Acetobacteraceae bacterium]|nr:hypothetical protein [Acetobacteraceae bacterium]